MGIAVVGTGEFKNRTLVDSFYQLMFGTNGQFQGPNGCADGKVYMLTKETMMFKF